MTAATALASSTLMLVIANACWPNFAIRPRCMLLVLIARSAWMRSVMSRPMPR